MYTIRSQEKMFIRIYIGSTLLEMAALYTNCNILLLFHGISVINSSALARIPEGKCKGFNFFPSVRGTFSMIRKTFFTVHGFQFTKSSKKREAAIPFEAERVGKCSISGA